MTESLENTKGDMDMDKEEVIKLIDDLCMAALNLKLASKNLKKWEDVYEELLDEFNNNISCLDENIIDEEFNKKVIEAKKILEILENDK